MKKWFRKAKTPDTVTALKDPLPEYTNSSIAAKIEDRVHSREDREMLRLKLIDGLTLSDIATLQNRPLSTVRDHYYALREVLFRK